MNLGKIGLGKSEVSGIMCGPCRARGVGGGGGRERFFNSNIEQFRQVAKLKYITLFFVPFKLTEMM